MPCLMPAPLLSLSMSLSTLFSCAAPHREVYAAATAAQMTSARLAARAPALNHASAVVVTNHFVKSRFQT